MRRARDREELLEPRLPFAEEARPRHDVARRDLEDGGRDDARLAREAARDLLDDRRLPGARGTDEHDGARPLREQARPGELDLAVAAVGAGAAPLDAGRELAPELGEAGRVERLRAQLVHERGERRIELARPVGERIRERLAARRGDVPEREDEVVLAAALRSLEEKGDGAVLDERVLLAAHLARERSERVEREGRLGREPSDRLDEGAPHRGVAFEAEVAPQGVERGSSSELAERLGRGLADEGLLLVPQHRLELGLASGGAQAPERAGRVAPHEPVRVLERRRDDGHGARVAAPAERAHGRAPHREVAVASELDELLVRHVELGESLRGELDGRLVVRGLQLLDHLVESHSPSAGPGPAFPE